MPGIPGRVRFGDIDSDRFPDALLTLEFSSEDGSKTGTVTGVWINEGGTTHNETTTETINSILGRSQAVCSKVCESMWSGGGAEASVAPLCGATGAASAAQ